MRLLASILAIALLLAADPASGQVRQSGTVTARHAACWVTTGAIGDCGTSASNVVTSFGTTGEGQTLCANSAPTTAAGYNQLCFGAQTSGPGIISLQNFGSATAQDLQFVINGVAVTLPTGGGTFVTETGTFTATHVPCYTGPSGVIQDCGLSLVNGVVSSGTWQGTAVAVAFGGTGASSASAARNNLGLGTMSTQDASAVAITGGSITGLPSPTISSDAATKGYVDATAAGLTIISPSALATAAVLPNTPTYANGASGVGATLTAGSNTTLTVDGTAAPLNTIVLVKDQASALQNGQYFVSTAGSGAAPWVLTRCTAAACGTEFDSNATMLAGSYTFVTGGATNANKAYVLSSTVTIVGTTAANFYLFSNNNAGVTSINTTAGAFTTQAPLATSSTVLLLNSVVPPQGRLTVVSGVCSPNTDQVAQTTIYYAPCVGEWVPVYDGTNMPLKQFTANTTDTVGLSVTLGANWSANTLYDWFVGVDTGTVRLCSGPAWSSSASGTSSRGTGGGTTQLALFNGLYTNAVSLTCRYANASTFTCGANQCTYVGTSLMGASAGTIDLKFGTAASGGGAANLSICNMYNRADVRAAVSDTTSSWTYAGLNWRAANAGTTNVNIVSCVGDIGFSASYMDLVTPAAASLFQQVSIGLNSSVTRSARATAPTASGVTSAGSSLVSTLDEIASTGLNTVYAIESADGTHSTTFQGFTGGLYNFQQLSLSARM